MSELEIKVAQSLETLHKALTDLEPAVTHVQSVIEASNAAKSVVNENIDFIKSQKESNEGFKIELINSFNDKVAVISEKSNEVLVAVKKASNDLLDENTGFFDDQKNSNEKHKTELINSFNDKVDAISNKTNTVLEGIEKTAEDITEEYKKFLEFQKKINEAHKTELINSFNDKVDSISNKSNEVLDGVRSSTVDIVTLDKSLNNYLENIKKIDFPTRLTSIDNDISSVSSGLNNLQGAVNTIQNEIVRLERESKADAETLRDQFEKGNKEILENIVTITKENKTLKLLVIVTIIISLVAVATNFIQP